jgi:hypothetical protein
LWDLWGEEDMTPPQPKPKARGKGKAKAQPKEPKPKKQPKAKVEPKAKKMGRPTTKTSLKARLLAAGSVEDAVKAVADAAEHEMLKTLIASEDRQFRRLTNKAEAEEAAKVAETLATLRAVYDEWEDENFPDRQRRTKRRQVTNDLIVEAALKMARIASRNNSELLTEEMRVNGKLKAE